MSEAEITHEVGAQLPSVTFGPISRATLALYAGASGDHNPIHIDSDFAKAAGAQDVFAQGMLSFGVLARVVTEWAGQDRLRSFGARFVSITNLHDVVTCEGQVVEYFREGDEDRVRVALTARTQDGRQTLQGEATVAAR
jgi:acyl dehydratase